MMCNIMSDPWTIGWWMGMFAGCAWTYFALYRPLMKKYLKLLENK